MHTIKVETDISKSVITFHPVSTEVSSFILAKKKVSDVGRMVRIITLQTLTALFTLSFFL